MDLLNQVSFEFFIYCHLIINLLVMDFATSSKRTRNILYVLRKFILDDMTQLPVVSRI